MAQQQQFLIDFQDRMDRLQQVRANIGANINAKQQFTDRLKTKLEQFNDRLRQLSGLITNLKNRSDELEGQIGTNNAAIGERQQQIDRLNAERDNAIRERDEINQQINQQREETQRMSTDQQNRINTCEEQLRAVTEQKTVVEQQVQALQAELAARGVLLMKQFYNVDGSPKHNEDLELPYPDLSKFDVYKQ